MPENNIVVWLLARSCTAAGCFAHWVRYLNVEGRWMYHVLFEEAMPQLLGFLGSQHPC